ncbi:MAG: low molecular weight phosphatase family protein [Pseudomonadota bacterium]
MLFVCRYNAIRSPMAAALARAAFPSIYTRSAGVESGEPDPFAVEVMREKGLDISGRRPRNIRELGDTGFDLVITLAPEAHHHVLDLSRTQSFDVEYWPTIDPSVTQGSRAQVLQSYRACRDALDQHIRSRLDG